MKRHFIRTSQAARNLGEGELMPEHILTATAHNEHLVTFVWLALEHWIHHSRDLGTVSVINKEWICLLGGRKKTGQGCEGVPGRKPPTVTIRNEDFGGLIFLDYSKALLPCGDFSFPSQSQLQNCYLLRISLCSCFFRGARQLPREFCELESSFSEVLSI